MPQNSSTLLKLMTSLSSSFQSCLPDGGLVNHRVHVFCSWCLTLKLLGSSNTVTIFSCSCSAPLAPLVASVTAPSGEMGMVSSGTGSDGILLCPLVSAMAVVCVRRGRANVWRRCW
jgi:hypothetical protein